MGTSYVTGKAAGATFLMCPPKLYDVNYVINPWMEGNIHRSSREQAASQWEQLRRALAQIADVLLVEPQPGSPDMVFTANAGLVRQGIVALSSFHHAERQGEEPHFRKWFSDSGFSIREIPRDTPFEGEGDALFEADGRSSLGRTRPSHARIQPPLSDRDLGRRGALARAHRSALLSPRHLLLSAFEWRSDVLSRCLRRASQSLIETHYPQSKRIAVDEADALRFACNAVNVGRTILLNEISKRLCAELQVRGFSVVQVKLREFLKAGGAAKCLVLRLSEPSIN